MSDEAGKFQGTAVDVQGMQDWRGEDEVSAESGADVFQQTTALQEGKPSMITQTHASEEGGADTSDDAQNENRVPEKYEFSLPEDQVMSEALTGAFSEVARDLGLSQEKAQEVLSKLAPHAAQENQAALEKANRQWVEASKRDEEFGGERLTECLSIANKAVKMYGTPQLIKMLDVSGLGNHPEFIRFFYRAGKALVEDGIVNGGLARGMTDKEAALRAMYPTNFKSEGK